jgi:hypothetical protein
MTRTDPAEITNSELFSFPSLQRFVGKKVEQFIWLPRHHSEISSIKSFLNVLQFDVSF